MDLKEETISDTIDDVLGEGDEEEVREGGRGGREGGRGGRGGREGGRGGREGGGRGGGWREGGRGWLTVESLIKDSPNKGHLSAIKDTFLGP